MAILFYSHKVGPYRCFSNWYPSRFLYKGLEFQNSEQAMMWEKCDVSKDRLRVMQTPDPARVKALGRSVPMRPNWDRIKLNIVSDILFEKFSQNLELMDILISTGSEPIHEDCRDPWWGGGPNYPNGKDYLGIALRSTRKRLLRLDAQT